MESAPNQIHTAGRMHTKEPGRMLRHSLAHVARGSHGAMFFQWRAPVGGAERFHSALVPHAGPDSRVFRETVALGVALRQLGEVRGRVEADVALVVDAASGWALRHPGLPSTLPDHHDELAAAHRALWRSGYACDTVTPGDPLDDYRLLVLPAVYLIDDATADWLHGYVHAGGHLLVTYLSGVADEHARVRLGGYPGALRDLLGVYTEEFHPLAADDHVLLDGGGTGRIWAETLRLTGADTIVSYAGGVLDAMPAVTRHRARRHRLVPVHPPRRHHLPAAARHRRSGGRRHHRLPGRTRGSRGGTPPRRRGELAVPAQPHRSRAARAGTRNGTAHRDTDRPGGHPVTRRCRGAPRAQGLIRRHRLANLAPARRERAETRR